MKILHLVLCVGTLILAHTACGQQYATLPNQQISPYKRYILSPVAIKVSASNGRQLRRRKIVPHVKQSDSVGGQPANQVSLLEVIALALNLGNTLFAAPATQAQRNPASSLAAGVTTGILNYISAQNAGGQSQTTFNDPQNTNMNMADSAAVSKVRKFIWNALKKGDWNWKWETEKGTRKNMKTWQRMTNLNIFLNRDPYSQQVFNGMKNLQKMKPRVFGSFSSEKEYPERVIVLPPDYHRHPTQPHYRPSHSSSYPSYKPSHHPHYPSHHYAPPSYPQNPQYHEEEYSVPVVLEDDDEDDPDSPSLYKMSTELVDIPLNYIARPAQYDDRPSHISMDEDDDDDEEDDETEEDQDEEPTDEDVEEYKRSDESSKERIKTDELKKINNRLKQKKS